MESVLEKIRQARKEESNRQAEIYPTETVVDGCPVKICFAAIGDNKVIPAVQSMLISAYLDAKTGGECA